jgi:hypothetical protein
VCSAENFKKGIKKIGEFYAYFIAGEKIAKKIYPEKVINPNSFIIKSKNGKTANITG